MGKKIKAKINKTVFVGVSGGVDSSVSAALLIEAGFTVVGVFIRTWTPDFIECTWRDERRDAMRVCAHLGIPFLECDAEEAYKKGVADYMIEEYKKGNTPNPDVMCNREVKFGVFWDFAKARGADFIATGHYAVCENKNDFQKATGGGGRFSQKNGAKEPRENPFLLKQALDESKDQTYFLWTLTQEDLAHTLFPIGHLQKIDVRKLAEKFGLPTATKKDSQGVCFLGPLDMKDFLKHYIPSKKGNTVDTDGHIIGKHDGAVFLTLGERHGFTITKHSTRDTPLYVVAKDIEKNTITVSDSFSMKNNSLTDLKLMHTSWISELPMEDKKYKAQIRYHGEFLACKIQIIDHTTARISFDSQVLVSSGQSIVLYSDEICLGGGIVS
jgi:tRNA-specific 2-thiouridylase